MNEDYVAVPRRQIRGRLVTHEPCLWLGASLVLMGLIGRWTTPFFYAVPVLVFTAAWASQFLPQRPREAFLTRGLYGRMAAAAALLFIPAGLVSLAFGPFVLPGLLTLYAGITGRNRRVAIVGGIVSALSPLFGYPVFPNAFYLLSGQGLGSRDLQIDNWVNAAVVIPAGLILIALTWHWMSRERQQGAPA